MKLNSTQIARLFEFTKQHYVDHYDLQVEIVDHLAAAIEHKMSQNQSLSFENALDSVFKGFGIFGFGEFVEEKTKQISNFGLKLLLRKQISYFRIPQLFLTIIIYGLYYWLSIHFEGEIRTAFVAVPIFVLTIYFGFQLWRFKKSLTQTLSQLHAGELYSSIFVIIFNLAGNGLLSSNLFVPWLFSGLSTATIVLSLSLIDSWKEVSLEMESQYPEAFLPPESDD